MQYYDEPPPAYDGGGSSMMLEAQSPLYYKGPAAIQQDPGLTSPSVASRQNPVLISGSLVTHQDPSFTGQGHYAPIEQGTLTNIQIRRVLEQDHRKRKIIRNAFRFMIIVTMMIMCGIAMIVLNILAMIKETERNQVGKYNSNWGKSDSIVSSYYGHGIWGGICLIITGAFGIYGEIKETTRPMKVFVILSLVAMIVLAGAITCSAFAASRHNMYAKENESLNAVTLNIVIALLAGKGALLVLAGSIRGCLIICYRSHEQIYIMGTFLAFTNIFSWHFRHERRINKTANWSIRSDPIIIRERSTTESTRDIWPQQEAHPTIQGHQFSQYNLSSAMHTQLTGTYSRPTNNQQQHFFLLSTNENAGYDQ